MAKRWTAEEDETLRTCWRQVTAQELAARLPGRKWTAICEHVVEKKLHKMPAKRETILHAAKRNGYSLSGFRGIISRHGIQTYRGYKAHVAESSKVQYVDIDAVDRAVAADSQLETINRAVLRLCICPVRLARLIKARGYTFQRGHRFPITLLDDVAREWHAGRSERRARARMEREQRRKKRAA